MATQDLWRQPERKDGRNEIFNRMCILGGQSNWGFELMVLVVYALIKRFDMQKSMRVVEDDLAAKDANNEVAHNFGCTRNSRIEAVERRVNHKT